MRAGRAMTIALVLGALLAGSQPASADDPLNEALKRKQELERAVQTSRANTERYQAAANTFQAVISQTNVRIAELAAKQDAAESAAEA